MSAFFEGFHLDHVPLREATLRVRHGGSGPPVLLLHGHPRTHATWHKVAARLASTHTVVCPDLRGYGGSSKPETLPDHSNQSKRAMARDCLELMNRLGHTRFTAVGHDRGAYVAFRLAMDHSASVERLVVMDTVPIVEALERCDERFARLWWHWFFFAQPTKPEQAINADPEAWYGMSSRKREAMGNEAFADYLAAIRNPATVHAMIEDYRAGLGVDRQHDEADRSAGKRIACPLLVLWALQDDMGLLYGDPVEVWRSWADDVRGQPLASGHHMAEDVPEQVTSALLDFMQTKAQRETEAWRYQ
jgi:haloacetate dehalogenase